MTTGALMFAFANEGIDYVRMAAWSAHRIRQHLDMPVAVITDDVGDHADRFDRVIQVARQPGHARHFEDLGQSVTWYNAGRPDAWELSPWDRTLLLDTDYVVDSDCLAALAHGDQPLLAFDRAHDITQQDSFQSLNRFGQHGLAMWWATVVIFGRTVLAQQVFDCMRMVRANWQHYRDLYGIHNRTYRNDHALTIALNIVDGHTASNRAIPWSLPTVVPAHGLGANQDQWRVDYRSASCRIHKLSWQGMDFHAMGKRYLMDIVNATH